MTIPCLSGIYKLRQLLLDLGVGLAIIGTCALSACREGDSAPVFAYPYAFVLRDTRLACMPEYPKSSILAGTQGLAVVNSRFDRRGTPITVDVLESPDADTGHAVRACALKWRMQPVSENVPSLSVQPEIRGAKLYYYFIIRDGKGMVYCANDTSQRTTLIDIALARRQEHVR
jgi:hypothetical protein